MYASSNNKPHVQICIYWRNRLMKLQETIYLICFQRILLRCSPTRLPLRGSVFSAAHSSNTENCLNTFICVTYRACWTRIAEKCSLLPSWGWSPAVDGPILIWGLPLWGSKSSKAFKVRQRWLWFFLKSSEVHGAFVHFCLLFLYSSQSPLRSCCKGKLHLHFFKIILPAFENVFI